MAFVKLLVTGDAETEVEAADLTLAGDVTIVGGGKSLEVINLKAETATEITLDTNGDMTVTQMYHNVDTFSDAASDTIVGISGGNDGQLLILRPNDDARTVIVSHNGSAGATDNILLADDANFTMDREEDTIMLIYESALDTNGAWIEISRSVGGVATLTSSAPADVGITAAVGDGTEAARDNHVHDTASGFIDNANKFGSGVVDATALAASSVQKEEIDETATDIEFKQIIFLPNSSGSGTATGTVYYDTEDARLYVYQA